MIDTLLYSIRRPSNAAANSSGASSINNKNEDERLEWTWYAERRIGNLFQADAASLCHALYTAHRTELLV